MLLDSPAKINLFLHVTGKRPDGYHELNSLMCGITLYDKIGIELTESGFSISCSSRAVPANDDNLAVRAARLFMEKAGMTCGVHVSLEKNIPVGAGLGGGSGNAATVLTGLNRMTGDLFSESELASMGLQLGADVPFFIKCRPAIATGIGEKLSYCSGLKRYHILVLFAGDGVSTAQVYKKLNFALTKSEKKINSPLLIEGQLDPVPYLHNDLEVAAIDLDGRISELKRMVLDTGADGALMSGSGSSVFGLYSDKSLLDRVVSDLRAHNGCRNITDSLNFYVAEMII